MLKNKSGRKRIRCVLAQVAKWLAWESFHSTSGGHRGSLFFFFFGKLNSESSPLQFSPLAGRAGTAWRARAAFRTRSQFVPQMTHTRQPVNVCLRWRRTSGAAQRLRSSRGQVSFCMIAVYTFCWIRKTKDDRAGFTWSLQASKNTASCRFTLLTIATWSGSYHIIDQSAALQLSKSGRRLCFSPLSFHFDQIA